MTSKAFRGVVNLNVRDSVPDWTPFRETPAPEGAPNVLLVLYDDTGMAAWSPYGGRIEMPTMQRLADAGITYTQWHTTALCSPTRSCLLTGRNHHQNGFAQIAEGAQGFPGHTGHIPMENATMAEVLRENGWNTFWVGKNHNVPVDEWAMGATKRNWPLARGFDRFYGFIGGETNQWYPNLVEDNHYVDQPYLPEDGYHLSKDLADKAIEFIADSQQSAPSKPWYLWFCPGANHAPHHSPQDYIEKYRGQFDDGYEAYREWVLPRMIERGVIPAGTDLTPINPLGGIVADIDEVRPWDTLDADEKRLFARMAEVYAGFSEYTDAQVGRIVDYLDETGQLDNTIVIYCADNGASGEGSPNGSVNENKFFNAYPDDLEQNLAEIDRLGGPDTYNHYPTGWATAFSTPFKMFKRYTYQGGVADPLVISWPAGIAARGELREQYHHAVDIVPTVLECCGVAMPDTVLGYPQTPLPGVSMKYSFDDGSAPTQKVVQYYEMIGTRALWHEGWHIVARRAPFQGGTAADLADETWELYHSEVDRAEVDDLAAQHPEKVRELEALWYVEAGKYDVLPIDNRSQAELVASMPVADLPPDGLYTYYPGTSELPEFDAANIRGRSYRIVASVELTDPDASGVLMAQGSRFGGHSLFLKNRRLSYVYNFLGIPPEQVLTSTDEVRPGSHVLGVEFEKESIGPRHEAIGTATLYVDDQAVAKAPWKTQPGHFSLAGEGLSIGRDSGDSVTSEYTPYFPLTGGLLRKIEVGIGDDVYLDLERDLHAGFARD